MINLLDRLIYNRMQWALGLRPSVRARGLHLRVRGDRLAIIDRSGGRQIWINRANAIYAADMVNYFNYYFNAVDPIWQGDQQIVDYSLPRFHQVAGFPDFPIMCPSLVEPYQTCEQYLAFAQLQVGQTVLDLGCYSGLTAIAFSRAVGESGRVISVEPDPVNMSASVKNIDLYRRFGGACNITLLPVAVSGRAGRLSFSSEASMGSSAVSIVGDFRGAVIDVPCITLDELVRQSGAQQVDFVKMDIEGSELDVLRNAGGFLTSHRPRLIIEPHIVDGTLSSAEVIGLLEQYGYRCEVIEQFGVALPLITAVPLADWRRPTESH